MVRQENSQEVTLSRAEILHRAEELAQAVMHVPAQEALGRVQNGELEGTLFASKLVRLFAMLGDDAHPPLQAAAE